MNNTEAIEEHKDLLPEVDIFRHIYYRLKSKVETDTEAMKRDLTDKIDTYLEQKIRNGHLIAICIRGEPGTGKSVVGLELKRRSNKILTNTFNKKIDEYNWIASDQIEFLRMTKTREENVCMLIDEFSSMARTGANATTEIAEFEYFSDVCRIQYLHRIMCSPITILDKNAMIILDIVGTDKKRKLTQVRILYNNRIESDARVLGSAWINVEETLEADWFKRYEKKKKMRANMIRDSGVRDVRELEFAKVALEAIKYFKETAETEKLEIPVIRTKINTIVRQKKQLISYYTEDEIAKPVVAVLHTIHKMNKTANPAIKKQYQTIAEDSIKELIEKTRILEEYRNIK